MISNIDISYYRKQRSLGTWRAAYLNLHAAYWRYWRYHDPLKAYCEPVESEP